MSILNPKDNAKAAQEAADELIDHAGTDAPGVLQKLLDALAQFELVIALRRKP